MAVARSTAARIVGIVASFMPHLSHIMAARPPIAGQAGHSVLLMMFLSFLCLFFYA